MKHIQYLIFISGLICGTAYGGQWNFGGQIGNINFDSDTASREGVEDSATIFGGYAEYQSDALIAVTVGGEYLSYDDNEEFSALVEEQSYFSSDGDITVKSSDAYAFFAYADAGPRWQFGSNKNSYITIAAGFSTALISERSILNCVDCSSEDISIDGGAYLKLAGGFDLGAVNLGLLYRQFVSDSSGISDAVYVTIGTGF